jgi:hypothetical protein
MADKFYGDVVTGATELSIEVLLRSAVDNSPVTGVAFGSVTAYYYRQGAASPVQISTLALGSGNSAWALGGWFQISSTNYQGRYRFDVPDAMFAAGADWVGLQIRVTGALPFDVGYRLLTAGWWADQTLLRDWTAITASVPARSMLNALRFLRNRWALTATTLSVKKEDDFTEAWTGTITTNAAAEPVIGVDPG